MPAKKMGRPPSENPKSERLHLRVDEKMASMLNECTQKLQKTRSEVIRLGIEKVHDELPK